MKKSFTKLIITLGIILCATMLAVHVLTYIGTMSVSNEVNNNASMYPENFAMEIGLGLALTLIYMWIFHGVLLVLMVPNLIFKKKFANNPTRKAKTLDIVFTCLMVAGSVPSFLFGVSCCSVIFKALSYGLGYILIPFVVFMVAQLAYVVASVVQLIVCKVPKQEEVALTEQAVVE